jgi:NADH-quinone oxidoreductase subunit E
MAVHFTPENEATFQDLLTRYPHKQAALVPTLYLAQKQHGWLDAEVMEYVASRLDLPPSHVMNTATFYTLLYKRPVGKYVLHVCTNVSCYLRGCDGVLAALEARLGIRAGETTPDGLFTLEPTECVASCGTAPVMQVNLDFRENLTPAKAVAIIDELERQAKA